MSRRPRSRPHDQRDGARHELPADGPLGAPGPAGGGRPPGRRPADAALQQRNHRRYRRRCLDRARSGSVGGWPCAQPRGPAHTSSERGLPVHGDHFLSGRLHRGGPERRPSHHRRGDVDHRLRRARASRPGRPGDHDHVAERLRADLRRHVAREQPRLRRPGLLPERRRDGRDRPGAQDEGGRHRDGPGASRDGTRQVNLSAAAPGAWGSRADRDDRRRGMATRPTRTAFNLTVTDTATGKIEVLPQRLVRDRQREAIRQRAQEPVDARRLDRLAAHQPAVVVPGGRDGDRRQRRRPDRRALFSGGTLRADKRGIFALENADLVNIIVVPPYTSTGEINSARRLADAFCAYRGPSGAR